MRSFRSRMRPLAAFAAVFVLVGTVLFVPSAAEAVTGPTVTVNQAAGQADPTSTSPVVFDVKFSEAVNGLDASRLVIGGTAAPGGVSVSGIGADYVVHVVGMPQSGTVTLSLNAGAATAIAAPMGTSQASTSTDNSVDFVNLNPSPTVTINNGAAQASPTSDSPILFDVVFSEPVQGFTGAGVILSGSAGPMTATVTGSGADYTVAVSGMAHTGLVRATVNAGAAAAVSGNHNQNTSSTSVNSDVLYFELGDRPSVTIEQAPGQADPTAAPSADFAVTFSTLVNGFATGDVILGGTTGADSETVTNSGDGIHYTVHMTGMTSFGTLTVTIPENVAIGASNGVPNSPSESLDNQVTYATSFTPPPTDPAGDPSDDPTSTAPTDPVSDVPTDPVSDAPTEPSRTDTPSITPPDGGFPSLSSVIPTDTTPAGGVPSGDDSIPATDDPTTVATSADATSADTASTGGAPAGGAQAAGDPEATGGLVRTGFDATPFLWLGAVLAVLGAGFVLLGRRRN